MKLAIHKSTGGFHPRWIEYCQLKDIPYKIVNCYDNDIISQLQDCSALLWHFHQANVRDLLVAQQILFALEHSGFTVFPDFRTAWHFDDKVAQKYLLEAIGAPLVPSHVFFDKKSALDWAATTEFPKVFKLRGGAGSANVQLIRDRRAALSLIDTAFGKGFKQYDAWPNLKERWRMYRNKKTDLKDVSKGIIRLFMEPEFSKRIGRQQGYFYVQDFMPRNDSDIRIILINGKAIGLKRMVRENDFRASGSGNFKYDRSEFDIRCIQIAFEVNKKLLSQCVAYDFIFDSGNNPLVVEISFGFVPQPYRKCPGYWDASLEWHEESVYTEDLIIEGLLQSMEGQK